MPRGLLIGNTRWHWAERTGSQWCFDHGPPDGGRLATALNQAGLVWAAVGAVPAAPALDDRNRLSIEDVPLAGCPAWLGVDRALGAWAAWELSRRSGMDLGSGLLLADAGTVLSLTLLNADGAFVGGQLIPGLRLQLASMAAGTASLACPDGWDEPPDLFPRDTAAAMVRGALQAMASVVGDAQRRTGACLWICGGDGDVLERQLRRPGSAAIEQDVTTDADLVLKGLAQWIERVNPAPGR